MNALSAPFSLWFGDGQQPTVRLTAGRHFRLYPIGLDSDIGEAMTARLIDLIHLGMAVYVVDGLLQRPRQGMGFRTPRLELEVLDHRFWEEPAVASAAKECIDFLSGGDDWHIRFVSDRVSRHHHQPRLRFREPSLVCLYSGGLDSAAGLAARLREASGQTVIPVTVRHRFNQQRLVAGQIDLLRERYGIEPSRLLPVIVGAFVRTRRLKRDPGIGARENTHRCRPFLFTAVGGVIAAVEGADRVEVCESGIGAVNLPLMVGMLGAKATRSSHPHFLRLMSKLLTLVAGRPIALELPFLDRTKAEMTTILARDGLGELARSTASCVKYPIAHPTQKQCGACPACVFRRHALLTAGVEDPATGYRHDLFGPPDAFRAVPPERLRTLKAFLAQSARLEELDSDRVPVSFRLHLLGTRVVGDAGALEPFVELFRRYRREWMDLALRGRALGRPWADWVAPEPLATAG
jgi:7-cyano-7-deazaguanine synthase in queuosine biosynthesis